MLYLKVLISGLQSDKIEEPVKGALVGCIYDNSLGKITESMDKVIAENSGKISRDNPSELLSVMAQICGYKPTAPAAGAAPPNPRRKAADNRGRCRPTGVKYSHGRHFRSHPRHREGRPQGGNRLRRDFGEIEHLQVSRKGPADFVSKADQASERTIWDELRAARPDWGYLFEEAGEIEGDPTKPRFIVDPLDGTTNFLHGIPHFAISIAVQEPRLDGKGWGEVTAGLIYNPVTDESYWAEKARGAWLHDRRLRVSSRRHLDEPDRNRHSVRGARRSRRLDQDLSRPRAAGGGHSPLRIGRARSRLGRLGPLRGFWESDLKPWDTAAGCLLVREAGGFVSDWKGRSNPICDTEILAGNDVLHSRLHKIVATALKA
ncbi:inositol monophosphatase family protein [Novosphingobium resinovorum]